MRRIVLASASPRRKELLGQLGLRFAVEPTGYDESVAAPGGPHEIARALSLGKARAAAEKHGGALIIAADTLVVLGDRIIGQPHTAAQAREMLRALNGRTHAVVTGFTVLDAGTGRTSTGSVETRVRMKKVTLKTIDSYVRTKEPLDKAGGYAIQGLASRFVEQVDGSYSNVVGLPVALVYRLLREQGFMGRTAD
jgi:septum formation protein